MKSKKLLLCVSVISIFALSGCMKYILDGFPTVKEQFNAKYSITEPTYPTQEDTQSVISNFDDTSTDSNYIGIRYEQLTEPQKITYDEIYTGIQNYTDIIYLSQKINQDDLEKVYNAIMNTATIELIHTTRKYDFKYDNLTGEVSQVRPNYDISLEQRNQMIDKVKSVSNDIVASVQGLDTFQTVKFFHDYIITHCDYKKSGENYNNAYGVLIDGQAVCEGYSRAFKYLCDMVNIPCELILGDANIDHMWNLVKINGEWYHMDVTWDDPENKGGDYIGYSYFNVTDSQIFVNHTIKDTSDFPAVTSTDMNFYKYNNLCAYTTEELYNLIYGEIYKACINGNRYVYLSVNDKSTYDEAFSILSENDWYVMYNIIKNAYSTADYDKSINDIICSYDDEMLTFTITLW